MKKLDSFLDYHTSMTYHGYRGFCHVRIRKAGKEYEY